MMYAKLQDAGDSTDIQMDTDFENDFLPQQQQQQQQNATFTPKQQEPHIDQQQVNGNPKQHSPDQPLHSSSPQQNYATTTIHQQQHDDGQTDNNNNNIPTTIDVPPIDPHNKLYPYSMVWGTLPVISWLIPCIGHLGVCDSKGRIHDFHAAYTIRLNRFMTGPVYRYYQWSAEELMEMGVTTPKDWDRAVVLSDKHYAGTVHNIVTNNCHNHVATVIENLGTKMSMIDTWYKITFHGRWVSTGHCFMALLPSFVLWGIIIGFIMLISFLAKT